MDHEDLYHMILKHFGLSGYRFGEKRYNIISTSYDRFGFCGVLEDSEVYLYDLNNDLKFLLNENLYDNAIREPDAGKIER